MNCKRCLLTPPPFKCKEDCDTCPSFSPMDVPYPCCTCLQWEAMHMTDKDPIYEWLKGEVDLYNRIVHEGPIDHYTPLGYKRLVQLHAIASRLSTRFIQKKTLSKIDDPPILERITHYTSLYDTANRFTTADNYDTLEDVLYATKENLHQLMIFLNDHLELNFNLEPQPQTKTGPSVDEQLSQINTAIENGERPRPC